MDQPTYETLLVERDGPIAVVTINRPKSLNALNRQTIEELTDYFTGNGEDESLRVVILTGAGEKAFVAGADIAGMRAFDADQAEAFAALGARLGEVMAEFPKIIIAAVNGFALGGGCELAMACDFIYAADHARFAQPEVNLAVIPGFGGTQRLPRRVGTAVALEMVVTGEMINAADALRIGLVNKVFPQSDLIHGAKTTAAKIAEKGPFAVAACKRAIHRSLETPLREGVEFEVRSFGSCFNTEDQKEGMTAFLEKRPPKFTGH